MLKVAQISIQIQFLQSTLDRRSVDQAAMMSGTIDLGAAMLTELRDIRPELASPSLIIYIALQSQRQDR